MNRRNFFKTVTGFIAGVCVSSTKTKAKNNLGFQCEWNGRLKCGGQNGTLCPRCKYNRKEKPKLTMAMLQKARKDLDAQTVSGDFLIPVDDGLDDAFCYGGKLFRVYPDYFDVGFVMMRLRENKKEFNYVLTNEEYRNRLYRNCICEYMLAKV